MIVYGSTPGDPVNDDRYGIHQRRVEIVVRPRLPRDNMTIPEINEFCRLFMAYQWQDVKHTNFWHCEFCDKPTRVSKTNFASWAHLNPPKANAYVHLVCDNVKGKCAKMLRDVDFALSLTAGVPMLPPLDEDTSGSIYPLASSCAKCNTDSSASADLLHCSGCKLTRYCSEKCQKEDWRRHKPFCKTPKDVKWVWN